MKRTALHHILASAAVAALPLAGLANVYPTNLGQSSNSLDKGLAQTINLSYLLNEDATGVTVDILDSSNSVVRTLNPGAQTKGAQVVNWDGKDNANNFLPNGDYSFRVNSSGASRGSWTLTSTDTVLNNFELPRGVAVNTNPNSPYYGRVYVSNGRTSNTGAGRVMGDGVYMLNADLSDTGIPGGTGPHTAGVAWQTSSSVPADTGGSSPFRLQVGPDDSVYITDWSDSHSGLWQASPNMTAGIEVLDNTGRNAAGLNATHGSISDVVIVGTGANRKIYTVDEDFVPSGGSTGSVLRYDIGNTATFTGAPSGFAFVDGTVAANKIINFENSLAIDNNGNFWLSQNRSGGTDAPSLIQFDSSGTVIWESLASLGSPDPLRGIEGMAYDPVNDLLALVTTGQASPRNGLIMIFDPNTKSILAQFLFGGTNNNDVAFDNAGNLYVTNRSAERVRIWSPPNGGGYVDNLFSTNSIGPLGSIQLVPEPATIGLLLIGAMPLLRRRR